MGIVDDRLVEGSCDGTRVDQGHLMESNFANIFSDYFERFPWDKFPINGQDADIGSSSGDLAGIVVSRVGVVHGVRPSNQIPVARRAVIFKY